MKQLKEKNQREAGEYVTPPQLDTTVKADGVLGPRELKIDSLTNDIITQAESSMTPDRHLFFNVEFADVFVLPKEGASDQGILHGNGPDGPLAMSIIKVPVGFEQGKKFKYGAILFGRKTALGKTLCQTI
jgi:hypothetical protein